MAKNTMRSNRRPRPPADSTRYNQKTLMHDREYGFYWYAWLWKIMRPLLILVISLVIVLGVVSVGAQYVNNTFLAAPDPADTAVQPFVIDSGTSIAKVGENLFNDGYIKNMGIFKYLVQFRELTGKIQYGTFPLSRSMTVNEVIDNLAKGSATNERTITVIPGWTIKDIAEYLTKEGVITDAKALYELSNNSDAFKENYAPIAQALRSGSASKRFYLLEGYLAPDTYRVYRDATITQILDTLLQQSEKVYDSVFNTDPIFDVTKNADNEEIDEEGNVITEPVALFKTTLTKDETIILASIIEKEAGNRADYRKVSAVLHNRLLAGTRLECDSTINYALGTSKLILSSDELTTQSPYNTYANSGLPAGPICNPSKQALVAALYPDMEYVNDGYLYFCSRDPAKSNLLEFSKTKEEHDAAVALYRPTWIEYEEKQNSN